MSQPELTPEDQAHIQSRTRRMVGYIGLRRIQALAREIQEGDRKNRKAARIIAAWCAVLAAAGVALYFGAPGVLEAIFRMLS